MSPEKLFPSAPAFPTRKTNTMSRASIIVCTTSFLMGTLATHWIADGLTLWKTPLTDAHLYTSAAYYTLVTQMPQLMRLAVSFIALLGATMTLWSLFDGRAGNLMFDGASFFLYSCVIFVYTFSILPNLSSHFTSLPPPTYQYSFPSDLKARTLDLASSNLVCSVALTGVIVLQAGRWWAEGEDEKVGNPSSQVYPKGKERRRSNSLSPSSVRRSDSQISNTKISTRRREGSVRKKRDSVALSSANTGKQ